MIRTVKIFITGCIQPHLNLAMEEHMLRTLGADEAVLFLWQNRHTIVIGSGQNAWRECDTVLFEKEGGTLARRSSGGGAVYHDLGNLNFSFIVPREDYDVDRQLSVVAAAVGKFGLQAEKSGRNDLTVGGRKFSGNAFRLLKDSALHHGTLLIGADMQKVGRYLTPDAGKLQAKGVKSVASRVTNLNALADVTTGGMLDAMIRAFTDAYGPADITVLDEQDFAALGGLAEKYGSWEWNYGASPAGNAQLKHRFNWGSVEILAQVEHGTAANVQVYTDSMDETLSARLKEALDGCLWKGDELAGRAMAIGEADIAQWLRSEA